MPLSLKGFFFLSLIMVKKEKGKDKPKKGILKIEIDDVEFFNHEDLFGNFDQILHFQW